MPESKPANHGRPRRAAFFTLGCKVNQEETAALQELFRKRSYEIVGFDNLAEVYIINTCTVTHLADHKSRQMIRRACRRHPGAVTAAVGCYAQLAPEEALSLGVDVLVGTQDRSRIVDLVEQALRFKEGRIEDAGAVAGPGSGRGDAPDRVPDPLTRVPRPEGARGEPGGEGATAAGAVNAVLPMRAQAAFEDLPLPRPQQRARAFLKIEDGCDQFCSYCIVPFARGPVRSLKPELVREKLSELLAAGYREVVLTGVHTSAYGKDLPGGANLASLLRLLLQLPGEFRLRLSSVEPAEVTGELLEAMASPRICRHLHLPLQSGDDEILALMGRPYRAGDYRGLFLLAQERLPGAAVTADVMVGFPGETDLHFENTFRFIAGLPFRDLHVFKYSPRPGTRASEMPGQVEPAAKEERSSRLRRLANEQAAAFAGRFAGETLPVLVERRAVGSPRGCWEGLSDNYLKLVFPAPSPGRDLAGSLIPVQALGRLEGDVLFGRALSPSL